VFRSLVAIALGLAVVGAGAAGAQDIPLDKITVPDGFTIEVYASDVPNARSMALSPTGTLFVSTRRAGIVYAVLDRDQDQTADEVITIATGLNTPNGVAIRDGALFVAELNRILRYDDIEARLGNPPEPVVVYDALPSERMHGWKFIRFGPDGKLYVPVGAPCNICDRTGEDERFATITRMNPDGGEHEVFAHGIRNSVGFDWHPKTGELFFSDNGSDGLGDDIPADELNHVTAIGQHFGFPWYGGGRTRTPELAGETPPRGATAPVIEFQAHTASLGIHFYRGRMFPSAYRHDAFVAQHGSWNRSSKVGYRIMRVRFDEAGKAVGKEVFASGWLDGEDAWGRPVDIKELPDGSLLVSDDFVGAIYRISYSGG